MEFYNKFKIMLPIYIILVFSFNELWVEVLKRLLVFQPHEFRISISVLKYTCSKHNFTKKVCYMIIRLRK